MKKYKIGNRIITADSPIEAIKVSKMLDSATKEIEYLTKEEERAVEDYRKAIAGTTNPKLLELYKHILDEELEHIRELENADVEDCDMKDERLSPMTYKRLKELGVTNKQWSGWTQEQANEYIRNKSGKKTSEKKEEKKFEPRDEYEADAIEEVRKTLLYEDNISDDLEETQKEAYDTYEMTYGAEPDEKAKAEIDRLVKKAYKELENDDKASATVNSAKRAEAIAVQSANIKSTHEAYKILNELSNENASSIEDVRKIAKKINSDLDSEDIAIIHKIYSAKRY